MELRYIALRWVLDVPHDILVDSIYLQLHSIAIAYAPFLYHEGIDTRWNLWRWVIGYWHVSNRRTIGQARWSHLRTIGHRYAIAFIDVRTIIAQ